MQRLFVGLVAVWLVGCVGTSQVSVVPTPAAVPSQIAATPTTPVDQVQTRIVSGKLIHDFYWTPDSQVLVYAQSEKCPTGCKTTWYRLDVATGITTTFKPEIVTIDPQVWKRLSNFENPPEISPRQSRSISPSGKWVVYSRQSPSYTPPPCPMGPCLPPMELWVARIDGSEPVKVSDLERGTYCGGLGWFDVEQKALLSCGYEGPGYFAVVDLQSRTLTKLDEIISQQMRHLDWAVLSPDGARLAANGFVSRSVELQVAPLDNSPGVNLGQGAVALQWSSDSQRLYYLQRFAPDQCAPAAIHVYDFPIGRDRIVLGPEVVLSPTRRVTLNACDHSFLISPSEDAVLLVLDESGSWIVGLH